MRPSQQRIRHGRFTIAPSQDERGIEWASGTRQILRSFPEEVKSVFGRALYKAQLSKRHDMASLMRGRLRGVLKVGTDHSGDTYRVYYTLKCPGRVYVLYGHMKKSRRGIGIPKHEEDLIVQRLKQAVLDCREKKGEGP